MKGYENGTIPEGGSYLFTIAVSEGYETSGLTVRVGETVLEAADSAWSVSTVMLSENLSSFASLIPTAGNTGTKYACPSLIPPSDFLA